MVLACATVLGCDPCGAPRDSSTTKVTTTLDRGERPRAQSVHLGLAAREPGDPKPSQIGVEQYPPSGSKNLANVEIVDKDAAGVIVAHGSRFGGHSLFIKDQKLYNVYNFLGVKPEQVFVSSKKLVPGKARRTWTWKPRRNES